VIDFGHFALGGPNTMLPDALQADVAMGEVKSHAVDMVGPEGAARAALLPSRGEHEVLHRKLAAAFKQIG